MLAASSQTYQPFPEYLRRSPVIYLQGHGICGIRSYSSCNFQGTKEIFLNILSLITAWKHQNVVLFKKILSLIKPDRGILPTSFCNNLQKNIYPYLYIRFHANLYCTVILIRFYANVKYFVRFNANLSVYIPCFW